MQILGWILCTFLVILIISIIHEKTIKNARNSLVNFITNQGNHFLSNQKVAPRTILHKIPNIIYRSNYRKLVDASMYEQSDQTWKQLNRNYSISWFDDKECLQQLKDLSFCNITFLRKQSQRILKCFHKLIPGSFKSDLWRIVQLYKTGGIYIDSYAVAKVSIDDMIINVPAKTSFILVRDLKLYGLDNGFHNGFMMSCPEHPFLKQYILDILDHVENNFYGSACLEVTGPLCMYNSFMKLIQKDDVQFGSNTINNNNNNNNNLEYNTFYVFRFELSWLQNIYDDDRLLLQKKHSFWHFLYHKIVYGQTNYPLLWMARQIYRDDALVESMHHNEYNNKHKGEESNRRKKKQRKKV